MKSIYDENLKTLKKLNLMELAIRPIPSTIASGSGYGLVMLIDKQSHKIIKLGTFISQEDIDDNPASYLLSVFFLEWILENLN